MFLKVRVCSRILLQNNIAIWSLTTPKKCKGRAATLTPLFLQLKIRSVVWAKDPVVYIIGCCGLYQSSRGLYQSSRGLYQSSRGLYQSSRGLYQSSRGLYQSSPWFISKLPWFMSKLPWLISKHPVLYIIDPCLFCIDDFRNVNVATCRGLD